MVVLIKVFVHIEELYDIVEISIPNSNKISSIFLKKKLIRTWSDSRLNLLKVEVNWAINMESKSILQTRRNAVIVIGVIKWPNWHEGFVGSSVRLHGGSIFSA